MKSRPRTPTPAGSPGGRSGTSAACRSATREDTARHARTPPMHWGNRQRARCCLPIQGTGQDVARKRRPDPDKLGASCFASCPSNERDVFVDGLWNRSHKGKNRLRSPLGREAPSFCSISRARQSSKRPRRRGAWASIRIAAWRPRPLELEPGEVLKFTTCHRMGYCSARRNADGVVPVVLRNAVAKLLGRLNPQSSAISLTERPGSASSAFARSMRRRN